VGVAHSILVIAYHMVKTHQAYVELGAEHFHQIHPERQKRYFVKRLQALGHTVILDAQPQAA